MSTMVGSSNKLTCCVVLDLDGVLLDTDGIVSEVLKIVLLKYGKKWDGREVPDVVGRTPLEAAAAVVENYDLPCGKEEFLAQVNPIFSARIAEVKALPGAVRLLKHLSNHGVPVALTSNSPRNSILSKFVHRPDWKEYFSIIIAGDEVTNTKPSPEICLEAAKRLQMEPSSCLVIDDSIPGVASGKAAGMKVVAVPSVPNRTHLFTSADEVISSLYELSLEKWGLPPFEDWIEATLPTEPWYVGANVIKGFKRGSKLLSIPTANLSTEEHTGILAEHPAGVHFGWAGLSNRGVYKMVINIGWNPYFNNAKKTIEVWLLHDFDDDFYGHQLEVRLSIVGYIRSKGNFPSADGLVEKILEDGKIAERALELPLYAKYKDDPYLIKGSSNLQ